MFPDSLGRLADSRILIDELRRPFEKGEINKKEYNDRRRVLEDED